MARKTPNVVKTIRHRVPEDAPAEVKTLADRALARMEDVLEERVGHQQAPSVLKAAALIREEVCGPVHRDINVKGTLTLEQLILKSMEEKAGEEIDSEA